MIRKTDRTRNLVDSCGTNRASMHFDGTFDNSLETNPFLCHCLDLPYLVFYGSPMNTVATNHCSLLPFKVQNDLAEPKLSSIHQPMTTYRTFRTYFRGVLLRCFAYKIRLSPASRQIFFGGHYYSHKTVLQARFCPQRFGQVIVTLHYAQPGLSDSGLDSSVIAGHSHVDAAC